MPAPWPGVARADTIAGAPVTAAAPPMVFLMKRRLVTKPWRAFTWVSLMRA